jgi:uncharacterized Zn-binding protein involved in type VI secretion
MAGEIIRQGDPTSHGGSVLEGSPVDICFGKAISFIGHKVSCPQCKGTFPIVEGVPTTTFYGKGVTLAGMKTACGAILIATQFLDTVEFGRGPAASNGGEGSMAARNALQEQGGGQPPAETSSVTEVVNVETEEVHFYTLADAAGNPAEGYRYDLHCDGALHTRGASYVGGATVNVKPADASRLVSWLERDGALKS